MKIRQTSLPGNQGGRGGCQFRSPYSGQTYYATVEYGQVVLRDWGQQRLSNDPNEVTVLGGQVSAHFVSETQVCVTVASFHPDTTDSAMETFLISVEAGR